MPVEALGRVDAVPLSHDQHGDNLDRAGRALLARVPLVLTTPDGAGAARAPLLPAYLTSTAANTVRAAGILGSPTVIPADGRGHLTEGAADLRAVRRRRAGRRPACPHPGRHHRLTKRRSST